MGDCAITGNVPSMRNPIGPEAILDRAYIENASAQQQIPAWACPNCCARLRPIHEFVQGGRVSARMPAFRRDFLHRADRAPYRRALGHSRADAVRSVAHAVPDMALKGTTLVVPMGPAKNKGL